MQPPTKDKTRDIAKEAQKRSLELLLRDVPEYSENADETPKYSRSTGGGDGSGDNKPPSGPSGGGGDDSKEWSGSTKRTATAVGVAATILLTKACTAVGAEPLNTAFGKLSHYVGVSAYILFFLALIIYFSHLILSAPLRPSWLDHYKYSQAIKSPQLLLLAVIFANHIADFYNSFVHEALELPGEFYWLFLAALLLQSYKTLTALRSPVLIGPNGDASCSSKELYYYPARRYFLTLLVLTGLFISFILFVKNVVNVFYHAPAGWVNVLLPWNWITQ